MDKKARAMTASAAAAEAGVKIDTLRFYERRGLIPAPERTRSNYRVYDGESVRRVRFIKRAQQLGFSLREIQSLLELRARPGAHCEDVRRETLAKIEEIDQKITSLRAMKAALKKLAAECAQPAASVAECPILDALESEATNGWRKKR